MSPRRRGLLLAGLSLLLGGLAASDVARREAAMRRHLSPLVPVVAARVELPAGRRIRPRDLVVRRVPLRYAPSDAAASEHEVSGSRPASAVAAGAFLTAAHLPAAAEPPPIGRGERAVEVVAVGSPELIRPGVHVDVLVTRDEGGRGATELALQDVQVLAARRARGAAEAEGSRIAATLRVGLRHAVLLTAAQSFAREIRLLPRSPGDGTRADGVRVGAGLR